MAVAQRGCTVRWISNFTQNTASEVNFPTLSGRYVAEPLPDCSVCGWNRLGSNSC